jgi:aromatic ring-cleaving dioxygenase
MCGPYFNEKALPPIKGYDIHIYFNPEQKFEARNIAWQIITNFPDAVKTQSPHEVGIVGPHLTPNFEVDIKPEAFGKVVGWLQRANPGLSILVHPKTGDELADHTNAALWLGKQLPLKLSIFQPATGQQPAGDLERQLLRAAQAGDAKEVAILIGKGADVFVNREEPLLLAAKAGHLEVVRLLVAEGSLGKTHHGASLTFAENLGRIEVAKFLRAALGIDRPNPKPPKAA